MSNYFFANKNIYKETTPELSKCDKHLCLDPDESRSFYKGKSFRFWDWSKNKDRTYLNDEFFQDFVAFNGTLYVCINTTTTIPGTSDDWKLVVRSVDLLDATANIDNNVGIPRVEITTIGEDLDKRFHFDFFNLKGEQGVQGEQGIQGPQGIPGEIGPKGEKGDSGEKGDKGDKGEQGIQGVQGEKGEKGEKGDSGNGNMSVGVGEPSYRGFENDIYLDIESGIFYEKDSEEWVTVGKISVGGGSVDLEWKDE